MAAFRSDLREGIARVLFDVPGEPVNTVSSAVKAELEQLLDGLESDDGVRAVVLLSGKPDSFIAGADINEFVALRSREEALALVKGGQALVNRIADFRKPIVAAIHGVCLGGGLEASLACTYRVATDHPKTALGLPEVQIGIIPAAGGCQRLPRVVGVRAALDMVLTGRRLTGRQAHSRGLVDELVHPAILDEVAHQAARRLADGWRPKRTKGGVLGLVLDRNPLGRRAVYSQARSSVLKKTQGHYPAPPAALEAVEHGLRYGMAAGLDSEAAHFAELAVGEVSRNLVRIFFATTALKKDRGVEGAAPEPRPVRNLAVVGSGFMGSGIAGVAVTRGDIDVRLRDTDLHHVANGLRAARAQLDARLGRRRISKHEHRRLGNLLSGGVDWAGFGRADVVVEAVFEDLDVKHAVFREVERHVRSDCIIASNTSTIPISHIAEAVGTPERVLGMHFFSPAEKMPLLEVIVTDRTAPWATVTAVALGKAMGKTVIVVRDRPGFWVNRILAPYLNEAGRLLAEGVTVERIDQAMRQFGFPVGPITLLDEVGLDVALKSSAIMHEAFGDRLRPMEGLGRMTEEGRLGRKSGSGFYRYDKGKKGDPDPTVLELVRQGAGLDVPEQDVRARPVYAMLNEAARAMEEGVVRSARDGDIGAIFGIGFPPFRGGPLQHMDSMGIGQVVATLERLAARYGDRFEPAPMLTSMAERNRSFHSTS